MTGTNVVSRELIRDCARILVIAAILMLNAGCSSGGSSGDPPIFPILEEPGIFELKILDSDESDFTFSDAFKKDVAFFLDPPVAFANSVTLLPEKNDIPIIFTQCDTQNAVFRPGVPDIIMCYELFDLFLAQYQFISEDIENEEERNIFVYVAAFSAFNFVLNHEIAHALHFTLELGIVGNSESAADAIATVLSVEQGRSEYPFLAALLLLLGGEEGSFGDVHSGGLDRGGDVLCWTLGGDSELASDENFGSVLSLFIDAGRDCVGEYANQQFAVFGWLPRLENPVLLAAQSKSKSQSSSSKSLKTLDAPVKRELADRLAEVLVGRL